jgi:DinB superfamily
MLYKPYNKMSDNILNQLNLHYGRVEQLLDSLKDYDDAALNRKPAPGSWSAIQTLHHLILSEELSLAYVQKKLGFQQDGFEKAGIASWGRSVLVWFFLNLPFKLKAPPGVGPEALPEQATLAATRARWEAIQKRWLDFFRALPAGLENRVVYKHPVSGRLSWGGMIGFFRQHRARHSGQIWRALRP